MMTGLLPTHSLSQKGKSDEDYDRELRDYVGKLKQSSIDENINVNASNDLDVSLRVFS